MMNALYKKLLLKRIWKRLYTERFGEPLLYNVIALVMMLFGTYTSKIRYDLVPRQPYAFGIDLARRRGKAKGITKLLLIEFGVAAGAGLMNMATIAKRLEEECDGGVEFRVVGFDSGKGMPPPIDYRDHPEKYGTGDFPNPHGEKFLARLPASAKLYIGDVRETVRTFLDEIPAGFTIGFISIDLDYYSSTKACLEELLRADQRYFLPSVPMYFDDMYEIDHNDYCGERLAIIEYNATGSRFRKITPMSGLRDRRIFKNAMWLNKMYFCHVFDSALRSKSGPVAVLDNPYLP